MPRPPSIFYTRQKPALFDEAHLQRITYFRCVEDWFGAAPICFVPLCRRAGRCCGDPQKGRFYLPPCVGHYREELRFFVLSPGGIQEQMVAAGRLPADSGCTVGAALAAVSAAGRVLPPGVPTVIEWFYGTDPQVLRRLRRSPHVRGPGGYEIDPAAFRAYIAEGDWRNPEHVCRREPVLMYGRAGE